jgi:hypothetical protein
MKARTVFTVGLGCAVVLAGAGTLWLRAGPSQSAFAPASISGQGAPSQGGTIPDREALNAEIARLKAREEASERLAGQMKSELESQRPGLAQLDRSQSRISQEVMKPRSPAPAGDKEALAPLTSEQVRENANARVEAQLETLDATLHADRPDLGAEANLQQAFQRAAMEGLQLANAQCGTTVCRMDLASDGSVSSQDSLRNVSHIAPWSGQGFVQIDSASGNIVVYVAREGQALPQAGQ